MDGPPPPPPHGANPRTTAEGADDGRYRRASDLPDGPYDIFIIPPHSSGSGFLYLPSLQCHRNSFLAGVASTLLGVVLYVNVLPSVKSWFATTVQGGGMGVIMLVIGVGVLCWAAGRTQTESGSSSKPQNRDRQGASNGGHHSRGPPPGPPPGSGPRPNGGPNPSAGGSHYQNFGGQYPGAGFGGPPPPNAGPQYPGAGQYPGNQFPGGHQYHAGANTGHPPRQHAPPPPPEPEYPKDKPTKPAPKPEAEQEPEPEPKPEKKPEPEPKPERKEQPAPEPKEAPKPEPKPEPKSEPPQPPPAPPPPSGSSAKPTPEKTKSDWEKAREEMRRKEEIRRKMEEFRRKRAEGERKKQEEQTRIALEEQQKRDKEARDKSFQEWKDKRSKERAEKEAADKEAAEKAAKEQARQEAAARYAAAREAAAARRAEQAAKSTTDAKTAPTGAAKTAKTAASASGAESKAKRPPFPSAKTATDDDAYSFRPYDRRKPGAGKQSTASSIFSEGTHTSQTTARTTPPPSHRGPYSTQDPDKIIIHGVYAFNNTFMKTPTAQLVSKHGSVSDGLILRITTAGMFVDDDVREVGQRDWDIKAWTMKLVEVWCPLLCANPPVSRKDPPKSGPFRFTASHASKIPRKEDADAYAEAWLKTCNDKCRKGSRSGDSVSQSNAQSIDGKLVDKQTAQGPRGLHVVRASIRDDGGRKYVFVLPENQSWKVAVGLQRLRAGSQTRGLGVCGLPLNETHAILSNLGY